MYCIVLYCIHPDVARAFRAGHFVIQKTGNDFTGIAFDHAHEQNNAVIKGDGGVIGTTEDENSLKRWCVAMPEVIDLLNQYKSQSSQVTGNKHHEQTMPAQLEFMKKVLSLADTLKKLRNPFQEESPELFTLDTKTIVDPSIAALIPTT